MPIQYTPLELLKFNTKENTETAQNKPEFQRLRVLLSNVVRKSQDYGYSEVYGYFDQKEEVCKKIEKSEEKKMKNKHKNYLRRQRAKRVKEMKRKNKENQEKSVDEKVCEKAILPKYRNSRLFKRSSS